MADNGLTQVVTEPTFHQNTHDLLFTNNTTCVHNTKVIPGISADGHHAVYVECDITRIRNKQVPSEIKLYSKTDWEGLKDRMSTIKHLFMATHSVDTPTDSMWNDLMTELERALDEFVPKNNKRHSVR